MSTICIVERKSIKINTIEFFKRNYYNYYYSTIYWNPNLGSLNSSIVISTATILNHEAAHALEHKTKY